MSHSASLPIIAGILFTAGLVVLGFLMVKIFRNALQSERERRYQASAWRSELRRLLAVVLGLAAIGLANLTFWVNSQLNLYNPASPGFPLGAVTIIETGESLPRFIYSTMSAGGREAYEVFPVRDASFRLYGERIHWARPLAVLGLGDFFKVTHVEFLPPGIDNVVRAPTFRADIRQGSSSLFAKIESVDSWLPFVDVERYTTPTYDAGGEFAVNLLLDDGNLVLR